MNIALGKNHNYINTYNPYLNNYNGLSFSEKIDVLKERYNLNTNFHREENNNNDDVVMEKEYFLTKLAISK
jgi:hypothetical protein